MTKHILEFARSELLGIISALNLAIEYRQSDIASCLPPSRRDDTPYDKQRRRVWTSDVKRYLGICRKLQRAIR